MMKDIWHASKNLFCTEFLLHDFRFMIYMHIVIIIYKINWACTLTIYSEYVLLDFMKESWKQYSEATSNKAHEHSLLFHNLCWQFHAIFILYGLLNVLCAQNPGDLNETIISLLVVKMAPLTSYKILSIKVKYIK